MRNITPTLEEKLKSNYQTKANNSDPKMSVNVSRARTTIMDSDYWTVETIREKPNLGDVSVVARRFKPYGGPNRIYEIHVDNGVVITAIREYPDKLKDGWKDQFTLGDGTAVAIAFDGEWNRYRGLWRLVTGNKPWIFWVDSKGVLWRQFWDEGITRSKLDTNVYKVRGIRAWKNQYSSDLDQGIIVGYIKKDGTVWYRNYCKQEDGTCIWEVSQKINFKGIAVNLNLFITNDYRMGFCIEDTSGNIHWLITQRNWSGMAIGVETITANISNININFAEITSLESYIENEYLESTVSKTEINLCPYDMDLSVIESEIIEPNIVKLTFLYDVFVEDYSYMYFKIKNRYFDETAIEAKVGEYSNELLLTCNKKINPNIETYITHLNNSTFRLMPSSVCKPVVAPFNHMVEPMPANPGYTNLTMEASISRVKLIFNRIDWIYNGLEQHTIIANISRVKIVLTKVGTEPI